jgi:DNA-binding GntR family transcriptional regulator
VLDKNKKIPQYKRLHEILRRKIADGIYKEGELLPSENELCDIYGLTRPTIRQALTQLVQDGYISKQQGKGSIVNKIPQGIGILSVSGTTSALKNKDLRTLILEKPRIAKWPGRFMFHLSDTETESGCIHMTRLRLLDRVPIFYDISFIPDTGLPGFTSLEFENRSLFDILRREYQVEIKAGEQNIKAINATKKICDYLQIEHGDPVLHMERKLITNRKELNIYSSIYCNTKVHSIYGTF